MSTIFTIGYSVRPIGEFVALLRQVAVDCLVDVRINPWSQTSPQFDADVLPRSLAAAGLTYSYLRRLSGPRDGDKAAPTRNTFWQDTLLDNYADYAETAAFRKGLNELRVIALDHCCAVMGDDVLWRHCYRRIITDHLLAEGVTVAHIVGVNKTDLARLTLGAIVRPDGRITYPAADL
jgi:uncharacterized protein (DUF488 family)